MLIRETEKGNRLRRVLDDKTGENAPESVVGSRKTGTDTIFKLPKMRLQTAGGVVSPCFSVYLGETVGNFLAGLRYYLWCDNSAETTIRCVFSRYSVDLAHKVG